MNFNCELCNYSGRDKSDFNKHLMTKKHVEKVNETTTHTNNIHMTYQNEEEKCQFCEKIYSNSSSLSRHKKVCSEKKRLIDNYEAQINELTKTIEQKDELLKKTEETLKKTEESITIQKLEIIHLKSLINNTGIIIKTSVSTMAYVIKNFKDAPALESVKDYSLLHFEQQSNAEFVENLIVEYKNNTLHIYVSDFIIKTYKKADPSKQSFWNSDTSRLTYIIRELISQNKLDWTVDKRGLKVIKKVVDPVLEYIEEQAREYVKNVKVNKNDKANEMEKKLSQQKLGNEIISQIENKVLSDEIIKYITPHFYLIRTDELNHD